MVLRHKGYGIFISSGGKVLEEYNIQVETDATISCYVASEEGKPFSIHWEDYKAAENDHTTFGPLAKAIVFYMDGNNMAANHSLHGSSGLCDGSPVGSFGSRPFQFAKIRTTDDDHVAAQNDFKHEHLGLIEIRIRRSLAITVPSLGHPAYSYPDSGLVHERSKKAGSHRVALGEVQPRPQNYVLPTYVDSAPYAVFRFRYRSRDLLQAQGIISVLSPPPPRLSSQSKPSTSAGVKREYEDEPDVITISDSDSDDEIHLKRKMKLLQERLSRKRAKTSNVKPKREPISTADIIDLT